MGCGKIPAAGLEWPVRSPVDRAPESRLTMPITVLRNMVVVSIAHLKIVPTKHLAVLSAKNVVENIHLQGFALYKVATYLHVQVVNVIGMVIMLFALYKVATYLHVQVVNVIGMVILVALEKVATNLYVKVVNVIFTMLAKQES